MTAPDNAGPALDDPRVIAALDEYLAALEAGHKPDRQDFLSRHAEVADALAECLEGMEALHEVSSSGSSPRPLGSAAADWQPGTPLGDFRILREVGRGGMGVVYEAEQISLDRRIALKVLPFALTLDPRQLQRFKNEARAAAQLHHQNIVPVHAVGCERGVHFYAMQYIEGQSLAELILGLRQLGRPGKPATLPGVSNGPFVKDSGAAAAETASAAIGALATAYSKNTTEFYRAAARLGIQAALALEHAHQYGVIHRDVKPANLLVDAHGQLWVTDFGLAQFQADAGLTQTGDLLGTLRYMSPEQAAGQRVLMDHRTDVYSLGATLYELLTLRPPFDGGDRQTLLRQILHDEPRPPRAVEASIPTELETIVLKALAKAPAERYASARELADDLSRYLAHQPVRARRATAVQRLLKWGRRHPSVVVAGFAVCLLTAAGSLVSVGLIRREEGKTQAAYEAEQKRAREAEERFLLAKAWVDETFKVCEEELAGQPHFDGLRRRLLEHALAYYQKLIEQRGDSPGGQADLVGNRERAQQILDELALLQGDRQVPLLAEPAVLDDLGVTGVRRDQINELQRLRGKQFRELFEQQMPAEEKRQAFLTLARSSEAVVEKVLTREQLGRLRQIALQRQRAWAFEDPGVTEGLKLTAGQRERIRMIQAKAFIFGPHNHNRGRPAKAPESPSGSPVEEIVKSVLTAEQARQWQKLTGEPFKGPLPGPRGNPPAGPIGPPPGPGGPPR
jgi:serine/threonine protein kinase